MFPSLKFTPARRQDITVSSAAYFMLPVLDPRTDDEVWPYVLNDICRAEGVIVLDAMDANHLPFTQIRELADALIGSNVRQAIVTGDNPDLIRASLNLELRIRAEIKARLSR